MNKNNKAPQKWLTIFLSVILVVSTICVFVPGAKAAELTPQQKAQTITTEVLGFDTTQYDMRVETYENRTGLDYLGVVPKHAVTQTLTSNQNNIQLFYTFTNNNLQMLTIYKDKYAPEGSNYFRDVAVAKDFLAKYQNYAGNSLYTQLSTIIPIEGVTGNYTVISENAVLEAIITEDSTLFKWHYVANGVEAPFTKFVTLVVTAGDLSAFVDNWQLYPVGSAHVGLSKDEAIDIALEAARGHVWSLGVEASSLSVENFNETNVCWSFLVFMGSLDADNVRSENPLEIYPVWQFGIALVKWHGHMYGAEIGIWADTGEVRRIQEAWSMMLPDDPNSANPSVEPSPSPSVEPSPSPSSSSSSGSSSNSIGKSGSASSAGGLSVPAVGIQLDAGDGRRSDGGSEPVAMVDHHETVNTALGDDAPIDIPLTFAVVIFGILVVGVCVYLVLRKRDQP